MKMKTGMSKEKSCRTCKFCCQAGCGRAKVCGQKYKAWKEYIPKTKIKQQMGFIFLNYSGNLMIKLYQN